MCFIVPFSSKGGRRQGYMGHLIRIVNAVSRCMEGNEAGVKALKPLDDDTHQKWSDFMSGYVAEMNKKNETNLVSGCKTNFVSGCTL